jgi:DNA-binding NtrC family response regulator
VARALHACGPHRQHLFVPLNCAALGREIIENELFGHERGAFTGANERKKGLFELADGGTLFLDEIGEMELATQSKLLRVLERNEFRRVGGSGKIRVDVSVIAATNRDLEKAVRDGRFREDLYYRLKVVTVVVPPLREHREDIPLLVSQFLQDFDRRNGAHLESVEPGAMELLVAYDWPGNVRELKHAVESAAILATGQVIALADVERVLARSSRHTHLPAADVLQVPLGLTLGEIERRVIAATLPRHATKSDAAKALGIGLRTLYTKIHEYHLDGGASTEGQAATPLG